MYSLQDFIENYNISLLESYNLCLDVLERHNPEALKYMNLSFTTYAAHIYSQYIKANIKRNSHVRSNHKASTSI